jgi:AcrR family transcriptional regulator
MSRASRAQLSPSLRQSSIRRGLPLPVGAPGGANVSPKLGRRAGEANTSEDILNIAEEEFAANGYDGTSLRVIADRAKVNQALIRYYFGSKDGLYTAIFLRRGHALAAERMRLLEELEQRADPPSLEEIIYAFLKPAIDLKREGAGGIAYMRFLARLQNETDELSRELRRQVYEESTQRCIKALQRAVPAVDPSAMYWRMVFLVGAYFYTVSDTNRLDVISGGKCRSSDIDESMRQLVSFLVGGMRAPLPTKSGRVPARHSVSAKGEKQWRKSR